LDRGAAVSRTSRTVLHALSIARFCPAARLAPLCAPSKRIQWPSGGRFLIEWRENASGCAPPQVKLQPRLWRHKKESDSILAQKKADSPRTVCGTPDSQRTGTFVLLPTPACGRRMPPSRKHTEGRRGQPARQPPSTTSTPLHPRPNRIGRFLLTESFRAHSRSSAVQLVTDAPAAARSLVWTSGLQYAASGISPKFKGATMHLRSFRIGILCFCCRSRALPWQRPFPATTVCAVDESQRGSSA